MSKTLSITVTECCVTCCHQGRKYGDRYCELHRIYCGAQWRCEHYEGRNGLRMLDLDLDMLQGLYAFEDAPHAP